LLKNLHIFQILDAPVLAGLSRKSMIYKLLKTRPEEALNGTSVLHLVALQQGAKLLRVHDVKPAMEVIKLWEMLENES
jgi:dihydropteroate synthase